MVYPPQGFPTAAAAPAKPLEATVFVAASDARSEVKALADYVCTGANDDATIESAFAALPTAGGTVKLSEGTFTFGSSLDILKSNVSLEGSGPGTKIGGSIGTSYIKVGNGATALSNIKISNLRIDGTSQAAGHGIYFYGASGYLITSSVIENCWVKNCSESGIRLSYSNNNIITGNNFQSNSSGIYLYYSNNNTVTGNNCQSNGSYGIYLYYSNNNTVTGNILKDNSQGANNSYDDIYVYSSNYNIISSNIIIATATNKTRYAVNESDSNYDIVVGNYCSGQVTGKIKLVGLNSIAANNIEV
jgi:parallel beta-helix repeat protein